MGLLSSGTPLAWADAEGHAARVRAAGIEQLINIYHCKKDRTQDVLRWGDEVEYILVGSDEQKGQCYVTIRAEEVLAGLRAEMKERIDRMPEDQCPLAMSPDGFTATWHPEYGRYMLEGTPARPYRDDLRDLLSVEKNMIARRRQAEALLRPGEYLLSMGNFPRLGCPDSFADPAVTRFSNLASHSLFFPDEFINIHPRFKTLTQNIRCRRGEKVYINLPLFQDTHTEPIPATSQNMLFPDMCGETPHLNAETIHLDAMGFGMGCCCLQITFQACEIVEARFLYDQLAVICPIVLALSAATPIYRGYLSDVDSRWDVISTSVDDRTAEERGLAPLKDSPPHRLLPKSRYASVSQFIGLDARLTPDCNDLALPYNEECLQRLQEAGFDELLAKHFAWLFTRDPLVIYEELLEQDNGISTDHFENIQSTNWQSMRFKPPPPGNDAIGWRVEFRPIEVQPTDFENAAFAVFVVLLTRIIVSYNLNFYMPISLVDDNMSRAQRRDAVLTERFHFPRDPHSATDRTVAVLSAQEIVCGGGGFPGLVPLIERYLDSLEPDAETRRRLNEYMSLIRLRAQGKLMTPAAWMRRFVRSHPAYRQDSIVSAPITLDLVKEWDRIAHASQSMSLVNFCCHYSRAPAASAQPQ